MKKLPNTIETQSGPHSGVASWQAREPSLPVKNKKSWEMADYASQRNSIRRQLPIQLPLTEINLGLGDSAFGPPPELDAINERIFKSSGLLQRIMNSYPSDRFCEEPTELIRERFGLDRDATVILHNEGSYGLLKNLIVDLPDLTIQEEKGVLGIGPQFPNIVGLTHLHGTNRTTHEYLFRYESFKPALDLTYEEKVQQFIQYRLDNNGQRFVYIDNPNNPTGDFTSLDTIKRLADVTREKKDILIVDEAYGDTLPDEQSAINLVEQYQHMIVLRGISKTIGLAGLRVGYGVMSPEIGEVCKSLRLVFGIDGPKQLWLNELLKPDIIRPHIDRVGSRIQELKEATVAGLQEREYTVYPTHMRVPIMLVQGHNFYAQAYRYQIVVEAGRDFGETYPLDDDHVRMKVPKDELELKELIKRLEQMRTNTDLQFQSLWKK